MKVRDFPEKSPGVSETRGRDDRRPIDNKATSFQSQLTRIENTNFDVRIKDMMDGIFAQGDKLSKRIDLRNFQIYKKMIAEFLNEVVYNTRKFSKQSILDRRGRHKVYAMIKKINEELDLLAKDILNDEKDNLNILKRLDDIRGLILDIMM